MSAKVVIAGGGPAGMMLGFLLARGGIEVTVLEKHADFFRDFRGDTIHPSTLELMYEVGLLDAFLTVPHDEIRELEGRFAGKTVKIADFSHVPTHEKYLALMPQWDFLNFLATQAKRYPTFTLMVQTEATGLLRDGDRISGLRVKTPDGERDLHADLVIGADGRSSTIRAQARLEVRDFGAPMDVLWMRISRDPDGGGQTFGNIENGRMMVTLDRGTYWQCAYVIAKGSYPAIQAAGIEAFRRNMVEIAPYLAAHVDEIQSWDQVSLLTVRVDRLIRWDAPGLLCIGDAAHAMSPIGGVGINLAIQDAVAAANLLYRPLLQGSPAPDALRAVQRRREFPAKATQWVQVRIQDLLIRNVLAGSLSPSVPWPLKLFTAIPYLRRLPAYLVGVGVRPEHIKTPEVK